MLPIAHLTNRVDPFDKYCKGNCVLDESYRSVVNAGVRAYQLHTYLGLVQQHLGNEIRNLVYEHQLDALDGIGGGVEANRAGRDVAIATTQAGGQQENAHTDDPNDRAGFD